MELRVHQNDADRRADRGDPTYREVDIAEQEEPNLSHSSRMNGVDWIKRFVRFPRRGTHCFAIGNTHRDDHANDDRHHAGIAWR